MNKLLNTLARIFLPKRTYDDLIYKPTLKEIKRLIPEEEYILEIISGLITPGEIVIDIGAYHGWYARKFSHLVGKQGKVYAFEPIGNNFKHLVYIVKKDGLHNVIPIEKGICEFTGMTPMFSPIDLLTKKVIYSAAIIEEETFENRRTHHKEHVIVTTLDDFFLNKLSAYLAFIRCEIAGSELSILFGAHQIIKRYRPALYFKILDCNLPKALIMLRSYGYKDYIFDTNKPYNHFFLTDEQAVMIAI